MPLWKWIDMPPVWLAAAIAATWTIDQRSWLSMGGPVLEFLGGLLVGGGLV